MFKYPISILTSLVLASIAYGDLVTSPKNQPLGRMSQAKPQQDENAERPIPLGIDRTIAMPDGWKFDDSDGIQISGDLLVTVCHTEDYEQFGILRVNLADGTADVVHRGLPADAPWVEIVDDWLVYGISVGEGEQSRTKLDFLDKTTAKLLGELELKASRVNSRIVLDDGRLFLHGYVRGKIGDQAFEIDVRSMQVNRTLQVSDLQDGAFDPTLNRIFTVSAYPGYISTFDVENWRVLEQKESDWFYSMAMTGQTAYAIGHSGLNQIDIDTLTAKVLDSECESTENSLVSTSLGAILYRTRGEQVISMLDADGVTAQYAVAELNPDDSGDFTIAGVWKNRIVAIHNNTVFLTKKLPNQGCGR